MTRYHYEIDESNAISVWDYEVPNEANAPFFYQPEWPNGTPWASKAEAKAWADLFIEALIDENSDFLPGMSPEEPQIARPEPTPEPAPTPGATE